MDSNSKHCPSRSSDNLTNDQKDPSTLPTSCGSSTTAEDRRSPTGSDSGSSRPCGMEEMASVKTDGGVVSVDVTEGCVMGTTTTITTPTSQTVGATSTGSPAGAPELSATSLSPGENCANERLSGKDSPSANVASGGADKSGKEEASVSSIAAQSQNEAAPQGTKRSHDEVEKEDASSPSPGKQKNKKRCFKCSAKLELAQREIGLCRCGRVFCPMHRLPELHGCDFDHKEDGRQQAREKMVKPTRHLGTSLGRLDQHSS